MKAFVIPADFADAAVTDIRPSGGIESLAVQQSVVEEDPEESSSLSIPLHPLGVKPAGNAYTATSNARHAMKCFQILPDEVLALFLEYLESEDLRMLGATCKFLYAFCRSDDLWKALFIE